MLRSHPARSAVTNRRARAAVASLVALMVAGLPTTQAFAGGSGPSPAAVTYDLLVERPLGLVELITGTAILPLAYPLAATASHGDLVVEHCVRTPGRSTFTRALGRLDDNRRSGCSPVAFSLELTQLTLGAALRPMGWIFGGSPFSSPRPKDDGIEI